MRLYPSKDWPRLHEDFDAAGQRYYCTSSSRFLTKFGQVVKVELVINGQLCTGWMKAKVPPWNVEDIRAQYFEQELGPAVQTPLDLFNKVPYVVPDVDSVCIKEPHDGEAAAWNEPRPDQLMIDPVAYEPMPFFSWWEIFTIINVPPPVKCKRVEANQLMV